MATISQRLEQYENAILKLSASWCVPCQNIHKHFVELVENNKIYYEVLDVDDESDEVKEFLEFFKVECLPTFVAFKHGKQFSVLTGSDPLKLAVFIGALLD